MITNNGFFERVITMADELKEAFATPEMPAAQAVKPSYKHLVYKTNEELELLESVLAEIRKTKLGKQLIADAEAYGTTIEITSGMRAYGSFDEFTKQIRLNANGDKDSLVGTLAHEMRHSQQFQKGLRFHALYDTPTSYIQNQTVIEADASVAATELCYDLATQGNSAPLEALRKKYAHIVNPFQNEAIKGNLANGGAHKAAFYAWYTDYFMRDAYETNYCKMYTQLYRNSSREESDQKMTRTVPVRETIDLVCQYNGKPYLGKEADDFFASEDMHTVSYERFNMIYGRIWMDPDVDYKEGPDAAMMKKFGLKQRPHFSYMPSKKAPELLGPVPTIESRQAQAARKIAEAKTAKAAPQTAQVVNKILENKVRS